MLRVNPIRSTQDWWFILMPVISWAYSITLYQGINSPLRKDPKDSNLPTFTTNQPLTSKTIHIQCIWTLSSQTYPIFLGGLLTPHISSLSTKSWLMKEGPTKNIIFTLHVIIYYPPQKKHICDNNISSQASYPQPFYLTNPCTNRTMWYGHRGTCTGANTRKAVGT